MDLIQSPRDHHPTDDERKDRSDQREEEKLFYEKATFWGVAIYVVINLFVLCAMLASNSQSEKRFVVTERAAIYLGLPDGTIAKFGEPNGGYAQIIIYYRNYGQTTAENVIVEVWPVVFVSDQPATVVDIPPFQGFSDESEGPRIEGLPMPAGFPATKIVTINGSDKALLETNKASMMIEGRISYVDQYGQYCQGFNIEYQQALGAFAVTGAPHQPICDGKPHHSVFGRVTIGHDKWKRIFPFKTAEPSPTWTPPPHDAAHTEQ